MPALSPPNDDVADNASPHTDDHPADRRIVTDTRTMKALAHPARLQMLLRLTTEGPATATECAQLTGLTPNACSYHLRHLAKYGYVVSAAPRDDAREHEWRATAYEFTFELDEESHLTRGAYLRLVRGVTGTAAAHVERFLKFAVDEPAEWVAAAWVSQHVLRLTEDELLRLRGAIEEVIHPFLHRTRVDEPVGESRLIDAAMFVTPRVT